MMKHARIILLANILKAYFIQKSQSSGLLLEEQLSLLASETNLNDITLTGNSSTFDTAENFLKALLESAYINGEHQTGLHYLCKQEGIGSKKEGLIIKMICYAQSPSEDSRQFINLVSDTAHQKSLNPFKAFSETDLAKAINTILTQRESASAEASLEAEIRDYLSFLSDKIKQEQQLSLQIPPAKLTASADSQLETTQANEEAQLAKIIHFQHTHPEEWHDIGALRRRLRSLEIANYKKDQEITEAYKNERQTEWKKNFMEKRLAEHGRAIQNKAAYLKRSSDHLKRILLTLQKELKVIQQEESLTEQGTYRLEAMIHFVQSASKSIADQKFSAEAAVSPYPQSCRSDSAVIPAHRRLAHNEIQKNLTPVYAAQRHFSQQKQFHSPTSPTRANVQ